jgi:iron complex outermembrane receptor protein
MRIQTGYWGQQRVNSNGLVDINPEDIASISILKGAAASALYGSEAANGVVMITSKSGNAGQKGVGVDFNMNLDIQPVAYMPENQTEFGPGFGASDWGTDYEKQNGGFYARTVDGKEVKSFQTTSYQWGPKFDGSQVYYYDGNYRAYSPITHNQWKDVFRTGFDQSYNIAITSNSEKNNMRFSYTYTNNKSNQYASSNDKHNFNLTGTFNLNKAIKFDYSVNYMRQHVGNRPFRMARLITNYTGMFGSFDDVKMLRDRTVTSLGYEANYGINASETPDENYAFRPYPWSLISEYFWNIFGKKQIENNNRVIASIAPSWKITKDLTFKGRIATDLTANDTENKEKCDRSLAIKPSNNGYYGLSNYKYEIYYGDAMLMFDRNLTEKLNLTAYVGYTARHEQERLTSVHTNGGLADTNWFNLAASKVKLNNAAMKDLRYLKQAVFGDITIGWDNWAYLEGTYRTEKTSTLHHGANTYSYPSINGSIIISEMLKDSKPAWLDYAKARVSYGIVGNAPDPYAANQAYNLSTFSSGDNSYLYNTIGAALGNENIKPEKTKEWEFGLEGKFFKNRAGFEVNYYDKKIVDQILPSTVPTAAGGSSILLNIGTLSNKGLEVLLYGTPVQTRDLIWDVSVNLSHNANKVVKLMDGVDKLQHWESDSSIKLISDVGKPMGDFYTYDYQRDDNGKMIIGEDGLPSLDKAKGYVKCGNAMPKVVGGFTNSVSYKNWRLDVTCDFRYGGRVWNPGWQYMMEVGTIKDTLPYREGHGGMDYYYANNDYKSNAIAGSSSSFNTFHDGLILDGVTAAGAQNAQVIPAHTYYNNMFGWGSYAKQHYSESVQKNDYLKLREIALAYTLPASLTQKFACKRLTLSVYGRNLFYFHKTLRLFDAEAADGTSWASQAQISGSTATTRTYGFSLRASF